jgi:hypothetical protein
LPHDTSCISSALRPCQLRSGCSCRGRGSVFFSFVGRMTTWVQRCWLWCSKDRMFECANGEDRRWSLGRVKYCAGVVIYHIYQSAVFATGSMFWCACLPEPSGCFAPASQCSILTVVRRSLGLAIIHCSSDCGRVDAGAKHRWLSETCLPQAFLC